MRPARITRQTCRAALLLALVAASLATAPAGRAAAAGSAVCTGVLTGEIDGNITVPAGAACTLQSAIVDGNISVEPGAPGLRLLGDVTVHGNIADPPDSNVQITSNDGRGANTVDGNVSSALLVCGAVVHGNLAMTGNTFEVALGGASGGAACQPLGGGNTIDGNVTITGNAPDFFRVADNQIGGNLTITDTTGAATKRILDNVIVGNLTCVANDPVLVVAGNAAAKSIGQCAT